MAKKIHVGIIYGGRSGEHEVSIRSAISVIEAIDRDKYEVVPLAITKEGRWLSPSESASLLPENARSLLPATVVASGEALTIVGDPSRGGLFRLEGGGAGATNQKLDIVFPVLHGTYGEDGTIQGLLEMADIPYVGCGVLASSCGMDKVTMKALFRQAGLPICKHVWFLRGAWERDPEAIKVRIAREIGFPCFAKPANLGSSVGISRADDEQTLKGAIELAASYDRKVIVEEALKMREIECAVLGNDEPEASLPGEYVVLEAQAAFLDYTEKYTKTGHVEFVVPAPVSARLSSRIRRMAVKAFKAVDAAGLARVDFFLLRDTNKLLVNELNTLPGLTDVSGFPKMWTTTGLPFGELIDRLIELAFERHRDKSRNLTTR
ncbi:MAG: D-alanine--D-alanine ligase [Acidobacteria bacterium]|nr:D-alanine--D-alanine ligase [Acidobacteriota bacterium]